MTDQALRISYSSSNPTMSSSSIIGYVDPSIVSPGGCLAVKTSCHQPTFSSKILRLIADLKHLDASSAAHQLIESIPQQAHPGKPQFSRTGAFVRLPSWGGTTLSDTGSLSIRCWCQATLPEGADHKQFLFSWFDGATPTGFACFLDETGNVRAQIGGLDKTQKVQLRAQAKTAGIGEAALLCQQEKTLAKFPLIASPSPLVISGDPINTIVAHHPRRSATFNGKIDGFNLETVLNGRLETMLDYDFPFNISSDEVHDVCGKLRHGTLKNAPVRAVTSCNWDASHNDLRRAAYSYGAKYFHDDDLDDAA